MSTSPHSHPSTAGDAPARPKVLRRPPQFSSRTSAPTRVNALPVPVTAATPARPAVTARPWQEDGRFGLVMIVTVLLVNLALMLLVSQLEPANGPVNDNGGLIILGNGSMPSAIAPQAPNVTVYAQPETVRRRDPMFDLNRPRPEQNSFSVSPADIPAPTARALDDGEL